MEQIINFNMDISRDEEIVNWINAEYINLEPMVKDLLYKEMTRRKQENTEIRTLTKKELREKINEIW